MQNRIKRTYKLFSLVSKHLAPRSRKVSEDHSPEDIAYVRGLFEMCELAAKKASLRISDEYIAKELVREVMDARKF